MFTVGGFATGQFALTTAQKGQVVNIALQVLRAMSCTPRVMAIDIVGHTDNVGTPASNMTLGLNRAKAVEGELFSVIAVPSMLLTPPLTLNSTSKGQTAPIASNSTPAGRAANRRVEVTLR